MCARKFIEDHSEKTRLEALMLPVLFSDKINTMDDIDKGVIVRDNEDPYHYFRTTSDNRIIIGGEDINFLPDIFNEELCTKNYEDEDLLSLSGIQHFAFCERQWALIHVEHQWAENVKTVEGQQLHERVDDPYFTKTRHVGVTSLLVYSWP